MFKHFTKAELRSYILNCIARNEPVTLAVSKAKDKKANTYNLHLLVKECDAPIEAIPLMSGVDITDLKREYFSPEVCMNVKYFGPHFMPDSVKVINLS